MANDTQIHVKQELFDPNLIPKRNRTPELACPTAVIELSSSDSDSSSSEDDSSTTNRNNNAKKKRKTTEKDINALLPVGFLDPLPSTQSPLPLPSPTNEQLSLAFPSARVNAVSEARAKQFWKAGDYEVAPSGDWDSSNGDTQIFSPHIKHVGFCS